MNKYNINIIDYILNKDWKVKYFDNLDLSIFEDNEKELFLLCRKIILDNKKITADNILKYGNKEMLLLYIILVNKISQYKLNNDHKQKKS